MTRQDSHLGGGRDGPGLKATRLGRWGIQCSPSAFAVRLPPNEKQPSRSHPPAPPLQASQPPSPSQSFAHLVAILLTTPG